MIKLDLKYQLNLHYVIYFPIHLNFYIATEPLNKTYNTFKNTTVGANTATTKINMLTAIERNHSAG